MTNTYTYTQTTDSKGHARFYRVDENGKRKVISRKEYEANTTEQMSIETTAAETVEAVEVEVPAAEVVAAEGETVYAAEPIEPETCTALVVPFNLEAAIAELHERKALENIELTVPSIEETALDTVKAIIAGMDGKHSSKVRLQATKKGVQVRYRNCAVCALVFDAEHVLTGIRFMGTTMETVNEATVCEPAGLSTYADKIVEQVMFIDWWWANASKKAAA